MFNIDLHIHTTCSDGKLTPIEILDLAKQNKINAISITDHDSIDAYTKEFYSYANKCNIQIITGIEISTKINHKTFHVLGYHFDIDNSELKNTLKSIKNARIDYLYNVSYKLKSLGFYINLDNLKEIDIVTKAHIAKDIVNNEKNNKLLIHYFQHIPSYGEFIEGMMNEGCPAFVEKISITPMKASELIKKAGGKVVLAHPVCYQYEYNVQLTELLSLLDDMKADGLEAIYIYIDKHFNKINEIEHWKQIAKNKHLFITMGSDYHFTDQIHPVIGLLNEDFHVTDQQKIQILNHILD